MPKKTVYKQSPRIESVQGGVTYNYHEAPRHPQPLAPQPPAPAPPQLRTRRPGKWAWVGGGAALLALAGTLVSTQLSARPVYYCAGHSGVKYHTNATCRWLQQCGGHIRSLPLGKARAKMDACRMCH